jgi:two-component system OmpR family response regulator/two-component system copper resistance phosphate regulon response regulator CusR
MVSDSQQGLVVLVVEDDPAIGKALVQGLREAGHTCQWERTGDKARPALAEQRFDVAILDVMLPGASGLELLAETRQRGVLTPVILLTALGSVEERVQGLEAGADDYVVKPFAFAELLARIEAVRRRTNTRPAPVLEQGNVTLDLTTRRVRRGGREIDLSPTEFSLLEILMRYAGQVVTRKMLCEHLWDSDWEGMTNVIEVHVNRLRGKLDRGGAAPLVHTVRGRGYVFRAAE